MVTKRPATRAGDQFEAQPDAFALFKAVVDTSDDAVFTCDRQARVTTWGRAAERIFGVRDAEVLGRELHELFAGALRDQVHAGTLRAIAGERIERLGAEVVRADGLPIPLWVSLCPIDASGRVTALVVIVRDITEQRLAQATLAEAEARVREGEAMSHVGSWLWDVRTGAVQWSAEFHRIHDVDPLSFGGTIDAYLAVVHPDDRQPLLAGLEESVRTARPFEGDYRVLLIDGKNRAVHVRAQPSFGTGGAVVGLRGIGREASPLRTSLNGDRPGS